MGITNYISLGNIIISEEAVGGTRFDYATDALGSVTATVVAGALQNVYLYKPYGSQLQKNGAGLDPAFRWVGTQGYRSTGRPNAEVYVRARAYSPTSGRWTSRDPLWPPEHAFMYAQDNPVTTSDQSGLSPCIYGRYCGPCNGPGDPIDDLDACCQAHDICLATLGDWTDPYKYKQCQCALCLCGLAANCHWRVGCNIARSYICSWACSSCGRPHPVIPGL